MRNRRETLLESIRLTRKGNKTEHNAHRPGDFQNKTGNMKHTGRHKRDTTRKQMNKHGDLAHMIDMTDYTGKQKWEQTKMNKSLRTRN